MKVNKRKRKEANSKVVIAIRCQAEKQSLHIDQMTKKIASCFALLAVAMIVMITTFEMGLIIKFD